MAFINTCERHVGKLLEIRVDAGYRSPGDVDAMISMMRNAFASLPAHDRIIIAADWRRCSVLGTGTAERVNAMLNVANPRTLRSSILINPDSPTAVMQATRLVSEANFAERRIFTSAADQIAWLAEVATPKEVDRLKVFLAR
jgi:hypothetical protein